MKIHFIGIGGIGVSALAQYYLEKGYQVSGSDLTASEVTALMQEKGATVMIGQKAENVSADLDLVVYSPAVPQDNPELLQAKTYNLKAITYPEALGELTHQYTTIAISGSHGKSTTTALTALALIKGGIDPTVIIGTKLKEFGGSNFRMGKSKYLVIEACEYDGSFLNYAPHIVVVTNADKEHLDYFKTFDNVKKAFGEFLMKLPRDGYAILNKDDENIPKIQDSRFKIQEYSLQNSDALEVAKIMQIPGSHNVSNALAALEVCRILGVDDKTALQSLSEFQGSWRRFEMKDGRVGDKAIQVISDYGHHPTEVAATLKAAREKYPDKKIWCIFQPHQHQRTHYLFDDFVELFKEVPIDQVIITDIYDVAGREVKDISSHVSSEMLVEKIAKDHIRYMPIDQAEALVKEKIEEDNILIVMGAGNVYKLFDKF